jgi:hypothetical protein
MSETTPGPWSTISYDDSDGATIVSPPVDGRIVVIAEVRCGADAALIRAAPDLLAACEAWAQIMDAMGHLRYAELLQNGLPVDAGDLAVYLTRTAIQKARGEE